MMKPPVILAVASANPGKIKEISDLLKDLPIHVKGLSDFGPIPIPEETGATFEENAYIKASFTARVLGVPALADDSGLLVEALGGLPGVHSARYLGESATDSERCLAILREMEGKTDRKAAFECVLSLSVPSGQALTYTGRCEGEITTAPAGANGFGYDPVFYYPPLGKTFAELSTEEKNSVSHRGRTLRELREEFDKVLIWIRRHMG
jgi:XTP/dITP diphosphohydrolase